VFLRWLLDPLLGPNLPLVTVFGAVAAAVWVAGLYPAMAVAVLGYLACDYLFISPRGSVSVDLPNLVGLVAYLFTSALIIGIGEAMRRAQQRANERGELLQVTLGSIGDAVITTDTEGRVTSMNAAAEALTGWARPEALGQALDAVFRIVNEQTRQPVESPAARALKHGTVVGLANHTVLMGKDGVERSIDDSAAPIKDEQGRVSGCVLIFRDVSERRRWEKEEAERLLAARQLATIVESSDDAIVRKSLDGIIQSWNAGAERIFGFTAEQAIGRSIALIIPPDRLPEEQRIIARLKAGERVEPFETERLRSDGRPIVVSVTISPIRDETGRVVAASKIVRDVTRQREAKERERVLLAEAAAANAKFRAFFEQGALFAGIMALDGTLLDANRLSWEGCGFTREQVLGRPFWEGPWWAPSRGLVERIKAASARAAAGETFRAEIPYNVADGSQPMVAHNILPIREETGRRHLQAPTG
jgi:PAS domain S-box-containing protein